MATPCFSFLLLAILNLTVPPSLPAAPAKALQPYTANGSQKIDVNLPALKYFCDGKQSDLKRYLEASPRWRVGIDRQGQADRTIAYRRSGARVSLNGFVGSSEQTREGFVFEEKPAEPNFMTPCVTQVTPDAGVTPVAICSYRLIPRQRHAYLYIGVPNLWLATVEVDDLGTLSKTPGMLREIDAELDTVRKAAQAGDPLSALSPSDTRKGPASLSVDDKNSQTLDIEAWVNPGEPGVTEIRVKSGDGAKDLTISHVHQYGRERVGYSSQPTQLFYANSCICISETATGWSSKHDVLFQVWFKPDAGGPERKLLEHRQTIAGYEN